MVVSPARPPSGWRPDKFIGLLPAGTAGTPSSYIGAYLIDPATGQAVDPSPSRLQIIANGGAMPLGTGGGAGDSNNTNADSRISHRNGLAAATNVRFLFANFTLADGIEVDGANDIDVRAAIELPGAAAFVTKGVTFRGAQAVTLDGKAGVIASDPAGVSLAAGQLFNGRYNCQVTSGDVFPTGNLNHSGTLLDDDAEPSSGIWNNNSIKNTSATNVYDVGWYSGTAVQGFGPIGVIGEVAGYAPAVVFYGDSIARGSGDNTSTNLVRGQRIGFLSRGMLLSDDRMVAALNAAFDGEALSHIAGDAGAGGINNQRRLSLLKYATHVVFNHGSNDIVSGPSLATMQANYERAWGLAKQQGVKVAQCLIMPRTSGTYTSAGGQTPLDYFDVGELRDQVNDWIETQVGGGLLDYVINPNTYVEDPAAPCKWISTGGTARTADGVHPNAQGHQDAAQAVQAWAERIALGD